MRALDVIRPPLAKRSKDGGARIHFERRGQRSGQEPRTGPESNGGTRIHFERRGQRSGQEPRTGPESVGAIVLAAGESKRFRSTRSKLAHPFGGRPLIDWPLSVLKSLNVDPIVVVIGRNSAELRKACGPAVQFAVQSEPLGTGHATLAAEPRFTGFEGAVLIMNGDLPLLGAETLGRLIDTHKRAGGIPTLLTAVVEEPAGWGRIVRRRGTIRAIVEERDASRAERALREVNVGVYCVSASFLFTTLRHVTPDNAQAEIYLTDIVSRTVRAGGRVADVCAPVGEVGQINQRAELAAMEKRLRRQINKGWMDAGVTLEDPETTYIESQVTIGGDTVIGPNVHLRGRTHIGRACRFDGSAYLTDTKLGDDVHVRFGVVMTEAEAESGCRIGPFAHLRPATRLGQEVHIGDFVETKNAILGRGTKANHLAYLGDAEIGSDTNIGAGTITCNYDGFRKHQTTIGDRVQVGSDTQLVAPVTLGDDVYVASGSTVRRDAPAGALVFNPRQEAQRRGWVAARRGRESSSAAPLSGAAAGRSAPKGRRKTVKNVAKPVTKAAPPRARKTKD